MTEQEGGPGAPGTHTSEAGAPSLVSAAWRGDQRFDFGRQGRPWVSLDGRGQGGPSPFDALLGAIAACAAIDVVVILEKRRTPVRSLEIEVVAMRAEGVPRRLNSAELHFRLAGAGIEKEQAERAIDLSINKYCSVRSSLDPDAPITWTLQLSE
jgi:putative redox protein